MRERLRIIAVIMLAAVIAAGSAMEGAPAYAASVSASRIKAAQPAAKAVTVTELVDQITATWLRSGNNKVNLRKLAGVNNNTYGVLQGCCSDGKKFAYFAFNDPSTDKVMIVKMRIILNKKDPSATTFKFVKASKPLKYISHGNDMAYITDKNGKRPDMILINTATTAGQESTYLGMIDPKTLREIKGRSFRYWENMTGASEVAYPPDSTASVLSRRSMKSLVSDHHGYSTISYNAKKNLLIATVKTDRDIIILRPTWNSDGTLKKVRLLRYIRQNKNNATSQGIDTDDKYIYTCWSPMNRKLSRNILQIYDYEGNHIGDRDVSGDYELESMFHVTSGSRTVYFAFFHYSFWQKYTTTEKVKKKKVEVTKYKLRRRTYCMNLDSLTQKVRRKI